MSILSKFKRSERQAVVQKPSKVKKPLTVKRAVVYTTCVMLGVFGVGLGVYYYTTVYTPPAIQLDYSTTGKLPLKNLEKALKSSDYDSISKSLVSGKSWIGQELDYANGDELRIGFINKLTGNVSFTFPKMQAYNKRGLMFDKAGNPVYTESTMTDGSKTSVSHIDYNALANKMQDDKDDILKLLATKGYKSTDYLYKDEMIDLMLTYINSIQDLPLTTEDVDITLENVPVVVTDKKGKQSSTDNYVISDDMVLDRVLFSSDSFHRMCDSFAMVISGWKPSITQQEQDNPEYAKYQRGIGDGSISADTTPPTKKIMVNVVVGESFPTETIIPYTWIGAYYLQNNYKNGETKVFPQVGNGSFERPAGIGTTVVTKAIDSTGAVRDIKIRLDKYWRDQEAIDYLAKFSEKNRGFSVSATLRLLCLEYTVTNLTSSPITISDDLVLADRNADQSSKTGTIFGLTETVTLQPNESKTLQSWASSTEMDKKYLLWGKSFKREIPNVWFRLLAGDPSTKTTDEATDDKDSKEKSGTASTK